MQRVDGARSVPVEQRAVGTDGETPGCGERRVGADACDRGATVDELLVRVEVVNADAHRRDHLERSWEGEEHLAWRREQEVGDVGGTVAGDDAAHSGVRSRDLDSDHRARTVAGQTDPFEATPADETDGPASVRREVGKASSASGRRCDRARDSQS